MLVPGPRKYFTVSEIYLWCGLCIINPGENYDIIVRLIFLYICFLYFSYYQCVEIPYEDGTIITTVLSLPDLKLLLNEGT